MPSFNYQKVCRDLISGLSPRQKNIVLERFGLQGGERKTLEAVGNQFSITRERVRQIQDGALVEIKSKAGAYKAIFQNFKKYFQNYGNLKKEDILLKDLGQEKWQNQVYFLLSINNGFSRFGANNPWHNRGFKFLPVFVFGFVSQKSPDIQQYKRKQNKNKK